MEGETSPIFERRATVSLKEKVNSLENKFLGMRQSIVQDIKKDLREELREGCRESDATPLGSREGANRGVRWEDEAFSRMILRDRGQEDQRPPVAAHGPRERH